MTIYNKPLLAILFITSLSFSSITSSFYINDTSGNLGEVNVATRQVRVIGNMGVTLTDIAFDPRGNLYGLSPLAFYRIDPQTAAITLVGPHGIPCGNALEFDDNGTLFAAGCGTTSLFTVDLATGVATPFGNMGFSSRGDLAFNNGTLYLAASNNQLVRIDLTNRALGTPIGPFGFSAVFGLDADADGALFGFSDTTVFSVDLSTGVGTPVLDYEGHNLGRANGASFPGPPLQKDVAQSIYYGNGVWAITNADATADLEKSLRPRLRNRMTPEEYDATRFAVAFNRSVPRLGDFRETALQILGNEYPTLLVAHLLGISRLAAFFIPEALEQQLNDLLRNEAVRRLIQGQSSEADVANHVSHYQADIAMGRKIVVVAHSQGNLFVNLAFQQLNSVERNSFAMIPVASPDSIARRTLVGHVTFLNDLVIDGVQILRAAAGLPAALTPNDFLENPRTPDRHEFSPNYLTDASSEEFILSGVLETLASLPRPPAVMIGSFNTSP